VKRLSNKEIPFFLIDFRGSGMKKGLCQKTFIYVLSVSFLLMMNGFPGQ